MFACGQCFINFGQLFAAIAACSAPLLYYITSFFRRNIKKEVDIDDN